MASAGVCTRLYQVTVVVFIREGACGPSLVDDDGVGLVQVERGLDGEDYRVRIGRDPRGRGSSCARPRAPLLFRSQPMAYRSIAIAIASGAVEVWTCAGSDGRASWLARLRIWDTERDDAALLRELLLAKKWRPTSIWTVSTLHSSCKQSSAAE